VSTSKQLLGGRAVDPEWKLFTAKAITRAQATVVPMFFEGQNSRLFQVASHISLTLRLSLLLNELRNKIGSVVAVRVGAPVAHTNSATSLTARHWPTMACGPPTSWPATTILGCPARARSGARAEAPCSALTSARDSTHAPGSAD
jgi:hypothetical protein